MLVLTAAQPHGRWSLLRSGHHITWTGARDGDHVFCDLSVRPVLLYGVGLRCADLKCRFLAIGVGLDPRQQLVFGPHVGPLLVGIAAGLVVASTTGVAPGYAGASINPARAFGLAVARGSFDCEHPPSPTISDRY